MKISAAVLILPPERPLEERSGWFDLGADDYLG